MSMLKRWLRANTQAGKFSNVRFTEDFDGIPKGRYKTWDMGVENVNFVVDGNGNISIDDKDCSLVFEIPQTAVLFFENLSADRGSISSSLTSTKLWKPNRLH